MIEPRVPKILRVMVLTPSRRVAGSLRAPTRISGAIAAGGVAQLPPHPSRLTLKLRPVATDFKLARDSEFQRWELSDRGPARRSLAHCQWHPQALHYRRWWFAAPASKAPRPSGCRRLRPSPPAKLQSIRVLVPIRSLPNRWHRRTRQLSPLEARAVEIGRMARVPPTRSLGRVRVEINKSCLAMPLFR